MQTIFRVAKTELRTLFYSPIAWFLLIVFFVQCSIVYYTTLGYTAVSQEIGGIGLKYMSDLTSRMFLSSGGLFSTVMQNLYLYIPLLTMSLISRETSSGTIKLLYSSPIKVREIVFGKYLAMMIYNLLLLAIISVFIISGFYQIQSPEKGMLGTALIGFYLLLCAYAAIGLFMSSLTTYQVVAAICTFVMIGILSYIGSLWQDIAFIRELTYFLSIKGRTAKMLVGLLTSKDVLYFILIIYIFLGFTIYKLKAGMESKPALVKAARYVAIFASALLIGYFSSRPGLVAYYDATSNKTRTLTPGVQKILAELKDAPLEITAYNNLFSRHYYLGSPESYNDALSRWEPYMRFKPDIKLNTVLYYDSAFDDPYMLRGYPGKTLKEIADQYTKSMGIKLSLFKTPEQIKQIIDLKPELNRYVMKLKWKDRTTYLRVFDDNSVWPGETEVAAALKRLMQAKLPKIYFLTGNLERNIAKSGDKDYKAITNLSTFRYSLVNQGFDVDTLSLETRDIPADISILVVADPKIELSGTVVGKLHEYINNGGNLLIAGEPGKQSVLNPILKQVGVEMMDGTVLQESKEFAPTLVVPVVGKSAANFTKALKKKVEDSAIVSMPGVAGLKYENNGAFKIEPLLTTDSVLTWNKIKPLDPDVTSAESGGPQTGMAMAMPIMNVSIVSVDAPAAKEPAANKSKGSVRYSPWEGDTKGPLTTAISLSRKVGDREQRIVIASDADFMSNAELQRYNIETSNFLFNTALFSWLNYGEYPIDATRPDAKDKRVTVSTDDVGRLKIIYTWIVPAMLIALGSIILIRRKRK